MNDTLLLKSGRVLYANRGIFGLAEERNGWRVTEGYDGELDDCDAPWTDEERQEIAAHVIAKWQRWAAGEPVNVPPEKPWVAIEGRKKP